MHLNVTGSGLEAVLSRHGNPKSCKYSGQNKEALLIQSLRPQKD